MHYHTNTSHLHIHALDITVNIVVSEILLLYQPSQVNTDEMSLQPILSQCGSRVRKPPAVYKAAKETRPSSSKEGDSALIIHLAISQAIRAGGILEHVGSKPPPHGEVSFLSLLAGVIPSCSNTYRDTEPLLYHQSASF